MHQRPVRVLVLVESGAANVWWDEFLGALDGQGIEISVMTVALRGPLHDQLEALECPAAALGCGSASDYPLAAARLARELSRQQTDVLHAVEPIPGTVGSFAGLLAGRRVLRVFHREHVTIDGPMAWFSWAASRLSHVTVACSQAAAAAARRYDRVPHDRIDVVYNGARLPRPVSRKEINELRNRLEISDGSPVVVAVARLREEKGLTTLLEAAELASPRLEGKLRVLIVGSGPQEAELKERVRTLNKAKVDLVGHQADVSPWLALADLVVMPSRREAFPFAAVEAMGAGRPLIASAVGGLTELVTPGETGLLIPPGDFRAFADGMVTLLTDSTLRVAMGEAAQRRSKSFTVAKMASALASVWRHRLAAHRG